MDNQLQHHGIKGMRWGIRRFQNKDGSLTMLGRKRRGDDSPDKNPEEDYETRKKKALASGSAKDILKFKGDLTNQELQTAITRLGYEKQLSDISAKDVKSGWDKVDSIAQKMEKTTNLINKGTNLYNAGSKILNAFAGTDLPTIDGQSKKRISAAEKELQKTKDRLIKSGTPEEIKKYFGKFTVNELGDISKRFNYEDSIGKRIKPAEDVDRGSSREFSKTAIAVKDKTYRGPKMPKHSNADNVQDTKNNTTIESTPSKISLPSKAVSSSKSYKVSGTDSLSMRINSSSFKENYKNGEQVIADILEEPNSKISLPSKAVSSSKSYKVSGTDSLSMRINSPSFKENYKNGEQVIADILEEPKD